MRENEKQSKGNVYLFEQNKLHQEKRKKRNETKKRKALKDASNRNRSTLGKLTNRMKTNSNYYYYFYEFQAMMAIYIGNQSITVWIKIVLEKEKNG